MNESTKLYDFDAYKINTLRKATALPLLGIFPKLLGISGSTWDLGILPSNRGIFLLSYRE